MIQADKDDVELLGYLKLDVLGVRMLSSMRHALDEIARTDAIKVDLDEIPTDDPATFELIRASDTLGLLPDRVARPARAAAEAPAHRVERPHRRHLAVPPGAGEVRHDLAVPAAPSPPGGGVVAPPAAARGARRDPRRDRLPRAGHEGAGRRRRLRPVHGRPYSPAPGRRRGGRGGPAGVPAASGGTRRGPPGRRADLGQGPAVRVVRVLQGARRGLRGADLPVGVAEGALPRALPGRDPHPRPRDVPAAADPGGRPAPRHRDPPAGRERQRGRLRRRGSRRGAAGTLRHPAGAEGRARGLRRRGAFDPGGASRAIVRRRRRLPAADERLETGGGGARARGGVRRAAGRLAERPVVRCDDGRGAAGGRAGHAPARPGGGRRRRSFPNTRAPSG